MTGFLVNATNIMVYYLVKLQVEKVICIVVKNLQYAMLQQYDTIFLWKSTHIVVRILS